MRLSAIWIHFRRLFRGQPRAVRGPVQLGLLGYLAWLLATAVML